MRIYYILVVMLASSSLWADSLATRDLRFRISTAQSEEARERARYDFLHEHMTPSVIADHPIKKRIKRFARSLVSMGISSLVTHLIMTGVWSLPAVQRERTWLQEAYETRVKLQELANMCSKAKKDILNNLDKIARDGGANPLSDIPEDEKECTVFDFSGQLHGIQENMEVMDSLYNTGWIALCALLSPIVYHWLSWLSDDDQQSYAQILTDYVSKWPEYKICTPKKFRSQFELLHRIYMTNGKTLSIDESLAHLIVQSVAKQVADMPG